MLPCGIEPSERALQGYKTEDGLYIFPYVYEGTYDYFSESKQSNIGKVAEQSCQKSSASSSV